MRFLVVLFIVLIVGLKAIVAFAHNELPTATTKAEILKTLAYETERLDGKALYVRNNRAKSWAQIVKQLEQEAADAQTWPEFIWSLARLNLAYPNLHSSILLGPDAIQLLPKRIKPKVNFIAEWWSTYEIRYVISEVDDDAKYPSDLQPREGDEILAINGQSVADWKAQNLEFCKFPLREQCDFELPSTFQRELLGWTRKSPLTYSLKRTLKDKRRPIDKTWTIQVDFKEEGTYFPIIEDPKCHLEHGRYSQFNLIYAGSRACIYESQYYPGTAILRVTSFNYPDGLAEKNEPITSLRGEIDALYPWWIKHAHWEHLILDVIDNHGGAAPIEYYQILLRHDFQEQFVTFKKTPEMDNSKLRKSIFWNSRGQETWFQDLMSQGLWNTLNYGDYTPPVPMFCADEDRSCKDGLFPVRPHPFRGRISVLLNQWCVSSCDGFAFALKENLGSRTRFFGHPQAADTAYSRLRINLLLDSTSKDGFKLEVAPLYSSNNNAFLSHTVVVTQSTTKSGNIVSGHPIPLNGFVPYTLKNKKQWPNEVLERAL